MKTQNKIRFRGLRIALTLPFIMLLAALFVFSPAESSGATDTAIAEIREDTSANPPAGKTIRLPYMQLPSGNIMIPTSESANQADGSIFIPSGGELEMATLMDPEFQKQFKDAFYLPADLPVIESLRNADRITMFDFEKVKKFVRREFPDEPETYAIAEIREDTSANPPAEKKVRLPYIQLPNGNIVIPTAGQVRDGKSFFILSGGELEVSALMEKSFQKQFKNAFYLPADLPVIESLKNAGRITLFDFEKVKRFLRREFPEESEILTAAGAEDPKAIKKNEALEVSVDGNETWIRSVKVSKSGDLDKLTRDEFLQFITRPGDVSPDNSYIDAIFEIKNLKAAVEPETKPVEEKRAMTVDDFPCDDYARHGISVGADGTLLDPDEKLLYSVASFKDYDAKIVSNKRVFLKTMQQSSQPSRIIRIEPGKKETLVTLAVNIYWPDNWLFVDKDACLVDPQTGDRYMVRDIVGDEEIGRMNIIRGLKGRIIEQTLVFPPLKKGVKIVDFYEPDNFVDVPASHNEGGLKVYGVKISDYKPAPQGEIIR